MEYTTLADSTVLAQTVSALNDHGIHTEVVATSADALEKIKSLIPQGASVMNGASRTLEQIGFIEYLKSGTHGWNNLHAGIVAEKDPLKQNTLRKEAILSDYYLGSVHAISATGEMVIASNTGSQLPHIVFTSPNVIFVAGAQKIVPTLTDALARLNEHVVPLEDARMKSVYGMGTMVSKILLFQRENPIMGRTVRLLIVNESLGF